jgi:hypothetical protein
MIDLETLESGDLAKLKKIPGWEMMVFIRYDDSFRLICRKRKSKSLSMRRLRRKSQK